jgi:hypothetical protein
VLAALEVQPARAAGWGISSAYDSAGWVWPVAAAVIVAALAAWHFVRTQKLRTIFVSYRRADSATETSQIVASLARHFGRRRVFHDVISIQPGENFRDAIGRTLRKCDAALVVIGPAWAICVGEDGERRLLRSDDVVRMEVANALASGALVVPVLVGGATMPARQELPDELQGLLDLNAVAVTAEREATLGSSLSEAVRAAPVRRTPTFIGLCHLDVVLLLLVFFLADGLTANEFSTALAIVSPALAAVVAVVVFQRWGTAQAPARVVRIPPLAMLVPLLFVAAIAALVVLKALNFGIASFETFKLALAALEILFAGYTGMVLASMVENRRST